MAPATRVKYLVALLVRPRPDLVEIIERNDKLPSNEKLRVTKLTLPHAKNAGIDQLGATVEIEGTLEADSPAEAGRTALAAVTDIYDPQGFIDLEVEPK